MRHDFADGKYTVINDNGTLSALRHGEPWARDLVGDNLVYWMLVEVDRLKALSVTNIMLDVVPGPDFIFQEVFAESVSHVVAKLTELGQAVEDAAGAQPAPQTGAEPVAQIERDGLVWLDTNPYRLPIGTKLYLSPAAQPAPLPAPVGQMTRQRASYFMERFRHEEKLLGPNEQAALAFVIDLLGADAAPLPAREPVACVTECEACFTPDACQLRGTCDHYAASQLRIATTAQPAPLDCQEQAQAVAAAYCRGHDAGWKSCEAHMRAAPLPAPIEWSPGANLFKDWCGRWFGPDSDDAYLAKAVFDLPAMAQRFRYPAAPLPATPDYLEGVHVQRLIDALTWMGYATDTHEMTAARLAPHINDLTRGVIAHQDAFLAAPPPAREPIPFDQLVRMIPQYPPTGLDIINFGRAVEALHGIPAAQA